SPALRRRRRTGHRTGARSCGAYGDAPRPRSSRGREKGALAPTGRTIALLRISDCNFHIGWHIHSSKKKTPHGGVGPKEPGSSQMRQSVLAAALLACACLTAPGARVDAQPAPATSGPTANQIADRVQAFYDQTRTFQADFKQEYLIKIHPDAPRKSQGRVVFE